jgi:hypothetical protein
MHRCEFCSSVFTNKYHLANHQKNAKYCIVIQNTKTYSCEFCDAVFNDQYLYSGHYAICCNTVISRKLVESKNSFEKLKQQNELFLAQLKQENESLQAQLKRDNEFFQLQLQERNNRIASLEESVLKSRQTININNTVNNFQPITQEHLNDCARFLTLSHIFEGEQGYANYALEYPLKDRIVCVDASRNKVKYKENDKVISDIGMKKLLQKIAESILEQNTSLINTEMNNLISRWFNTATAPEEFNDDEEEVQGNIFVKGMDQHTDKYFEILHLRNAIQDMSKNLKTEIAAKIAKEICARI